MHMSLLLLLYISFKDERVMHCGSAKALECVHTVNNELVAYTQAKKQEEKKEERASFCCASMTASL